MTCCDHPPQGRSMAGRLALVPEFGEWDNRDPALPRPRNLYRDLIRNVAVSRGQYTSQSAHSGSSYSHSSGASSSCCSSGSASTAATAELCADDHELTKIARRMVNDGYARRMVNEFGSGGPDRAPLETWFLELDVDWVLQIHDEHGLRRQLQDKPASSLQELVDKWIRALTVIDVSVTELLGTTVPEETPAVARFGKASIANMLVFVDAIIPALKEEEKLRTLVDMYVCVSSVSYTRSAPYYMFMTRPIYLEARRILDEIDGSLSREEIKLSKSISRTMEEVMALLEDDDQWAIDIPRGRGEVHRNTRFMVDCIMHMVKARGSMRYTEQSDLSFLVDKSVHHLKKLLVRKSKLCSDPSLRYLFLPNNFYSVAQLSAGPRLGHLWLHTLECKEFRDSYLDVSWGHVLSHIRKTVFKDSCLDVSCGPVLFSIPKTRFTRSREHRKKTSSLAKFESAFHKVYQAQKFWKVPDPQLRDMLRKTITKTVISEYRSYLKKHRELEIHVSSGSSSPDMLKEMLGELFEG